MNEQSAAYLHGDADKRQNNARIKRFLILFGIGTLLAATLIAGALVWRDATQMNNPNETASQIIVILVTLVWGAALIFFWNMKLTPLLCYHRYLKEMGRGLSRTVEGEVVRFDTVTTFRDGIGFFALVVNVGMAGEQEDERLLYWDARLKRPEVGVGDRVSVVAHGNDIIGFEPWSR